MVHKINKELQLQQDISRPLKVVLCPPDLRTLQKVVEGESADPTSIIQNYIAKGLQGLGYHINFLGPYHPDNVVFTRDLKNPVPVQRTWTGSLWFELTSKVVWRIQRLLGIPYLNIFSNIRLMDACLQNFPGHDLVYERNSLYKFGVAMACKRLGIPYILYIEADEILEHDITDKPITGLLRMQAAWAIRYNLNAAECVICVSEPLKTHLVKKWKMPAEKIVVFPNVADIQRFRPDLEARENIRASLGISGDPMIVFVGNFYEWHDVSTLLKAFTQVLKKYPNAHLVLVGDGINRQAMAQLTVELNITHAVIFTGRVAHHEVPCYLAAADIAVVPYPILKQDIWFSPLKLFEYMATGNAVIASNVGQLSDWIHDGWNGLLYPPEDESALAQEIERLIDDPALRMLLGANAREEVVSKHSWSHYLERLNKLFMQIRDRAKETRA